jgi:hypothetical protein
MYCARFGRLLRGKAQTFLGPRIHQDFGMRDCSDIPEKGNPGETEKKRTQDNEENKDDDLRKLKPFLSSLPLLQPVGGRVLAIRATGGPLLLGREGGDDFLEVRLPPCKRTFPDLRIPGKLFRLA